MPAAPTGSLKNNNVKYILMLAVWSIVVAGVYMACVQLEAGWILYVYYAAAIIFFGIFMYLNGGFVPRKIEDMEKPPEMGFDVFQRQLDEIKAKKEKAKLFLVLFLPFLFVMAIDYVIIVWSK